MEAVFYWGFLQLAPKRLRPTACRAASFDRNRSSIWPNAGASPSSTAGLVSGPRLKRQGERVAGFINEAMDKEPTQKAEFCRQARFPPAHSYYLSGILEVEKLTPATAPPP